MTGQFSPQVGQGRADDLLQHVPLAVERDPAGLQPRHVQQVIDEPGSAAATHRPPSAAAPAVRRGLGLAELRASWRRLPAMTASGVRRSCETELSSELRRCSVLRLQLGLVRLQHRLVALDRQGDQAGAGFQQSPLLGIEKPLRIVGLDAQSADRALRADQRHEQRGGVGQRIGASPATWSCSLTHWATTALIGCLATLVFCAEPQLRRTCRRRARRSRPRRRTSRQAAGRPFE